MIHMFCHNFLLVHKIFHTYLQVNSSKERDMKCHFIINLLEYLPCEFIIALKKLGYLLKRKKKKNKRNATQEKIK